MTGTLWLPEGIEDKQPRPTVLVVLGWGGIRQHADATIAPQFADRGYIALSFDYRGWGDSESRLVMESPQPALGADNQVTVTARAIRASIDPYDQLQDIQNAFAFMHGDSRIDTSRIGVWGTSMGGGLALQLTARDSRVKALVSQIGYYGGGVEQKLLEDGSLFTETGREIETAIARGKFPPIPQKGDLPASPGLYGTPHLGKLPFHKPLNEVDKVNAPSLIINAREEEFFDPELNSKAVYQQLQAQQTVSSFLEVPGNHYDAYIREDSYTLSMEAALDWFKNHL